MIFKMYKHRLKNLREEQELKLRDIDKILEFKPDTYSQFEKEKTIIPLKHLNTLCNNFNVSFDYIFEFTNEKRYEKAQEKIDLKTSGLRLKETRKELKLSQQYLASKLYVSNTIISEYEKGNQIISTHFLYDFCKKYNISADYLLGKTNTPKYLK